MKLRKVRVYDCECGGRCVRPLTGTPKPCEACEAPLLEWKSRIEDYGLFISDSIERLGAAIDKHRHDDRWRD